MVVAALARGFDIYSKLQKRAKSVLPGRVLFRVSISIFFLARKSVKVWRGKRKSDIFLEFCTQMVMLNM